MSNTSAAQWVKFFNTAGIPSPAAATYAHKFVENRIQTDMLMDLNKEYLREMDITPMGDIIAILRHAKTVSDQTARDKVLTDTIVPIAAITANPVLPTEKSTKINLRSKEMTSKAVLVSPLPKPRRVLPEHEGKYKIKLPTGSTERSKEILAKKAKLYSDREALAKTDVFKRLSKETQIMDLEDDDSEFEDKNVKIRITGLDKKPLTKSSSIFARLGDKTEAVTIAKQIKPILKNSAKTTGIIKAKTTVAATVVRPQKQKVLLVKKVPIKSGDDTDDDYDQSDDDDYHSDDDMLYERSSSSSDKIVKFASTAEVREIEPEPSFSTSNRKNGNYKAGIKARLDLASKLRSTKRSFNLKASQPHVKGRISPVKGKTLKLKSDELLFKQDLPVHQRLGNSSKTSTQNNSNATHQISSLSKRIGRVNITATTQKRYTLPPSVKRKPNNGSSTSSVFDRLGFTK